MRSCWLGSSLPDDLLDLAIDFDWLQFNEYTDFMVCMISSGCSDFNDWPMSVCSNVFLPCMIKKKRAGISPEIFKIGKRNERAVPGLVVTAGCSVEQCLQIFCLCCVKTFERGSVTLDLI